jgi:hypothetical protein
MNVRTAGLLATSLAVLVLLGSMVTGLVGSSSESLTPLAASSAVADDVGDRVISVEVLNGAGVPGLAREVTDHLRGRGFDVKYYGNSPDGPRDSTVVLIRRSPAMGEEIAAALPRATIETALDTTLYLDATIILGSDWPTAAE